MNEKLIKLAHVAAVAAIALGALIFFARGGISAQNTNTNTSANTNTSSNDNQNTSGHTGHGSNTNANNKAGGMGRGDSAGGGSAVNSTDRKFVMEAAMGGMTEVELGRLAVERGASDAVKQFGQQMIDDHTRANQMLMERASAAGLTPPAALDSKHRNAVQKMARLSGAQFDREYARQMVKDHEKTLALFRREAGRGSHSDLRAFASETLPALEGHLRMARDLAAVTGGRRNNNTNSEMPNTGTGSPRP